MAVAVGFHNELPQNGAMGIAVAIEKQGAGIELGIAAKSTNQQPAVKAMQ
jgi:hypothetical protein